MATWSISREQSLNTCERKYFFQYLATARVNSRDPILRQIALLKKLSNIPIWKGKVFHSEIAVLLDKVRKGFKINDREIEGNVRNRVIKEWQFSETFSYRSNPSALDKSGAVALFEHEYEESVNFDIESFITEITESILNLIQWLDACDIQNQLIQAKEVWIEPPIFGPNAPGFYLDGTQVITKVDLAVHQVNGEFSIYDWKTGKPPLSTSNELNNSEFQINTYLLWPHISLKIPLELIRGHLLYLGGEPVQQSFTIDENQRGKVLALARHSIAREKYFQELRKGKGMDLVDLNYAYQEWVCKRCNFKRLCKEALAHV